MDPTLLSLLDSIPQKPARSKLETHRELIRQLRRKGCTYRDIVHTLHERRLIKSPKVYLGDSGLACYLLGLTSSAELERSPFLGPLLFLGPLFEASSQQRYSRAKPTAECARNSTIFVISKVWKWTSLYRAPMRNCGWLKAKRLRQ